MALKITDKNITDALVDTIQKTFTPTGDINADKIRGENYAKAVGMNEANTKMAVILATQGPAAAATAMMEDCGNNYMAMRARYG